MQAGVHRAVLSVFDPRFPTLKHLLEHITLLMHDEAARLRYFEYLDQPYVALGLAVAERRAREERTLQWADLQRGCMQWACRMLTDKDVPRHKAAATKSCFGSWQSFFTGELGRKLSDWQLEAGGLFGAWPGSPRLAWLN
jgi:hypothetical protein